MPNFWHFPKTSQAHFVSDIALSQFQSQQAIYGAIFRAFWPFLALFALGREKFFGCFFFLNAIWRKFFALFFVNICKSWNKWQRQFLKFGICENFFGRAVNFFRFGETDFLFSEKIFLALLKFFCVFEKLFLRWRKFLGALRKLFGGLGRDWLNQTPSGSNFFCRHAKFFCRL